MIAGVCSVYWGRSTLILASTSAARRALHDDLSQRLKREILTSDEVDKISDQPGRMMVGTCFDVANAHTHDFEVVVFADAAIAMARGVIDNLLFLHLTQSRAFALVEPADLMGRQGVILDACLGPEIARLVPDQPPLQNVDVVLVPRLGSPDRRRKRVSAAERQRQCICHNGPRNRFLTELAHSVAHGRIKTLDAISPGLAAAARPYLRRRYPVVILVESIEHGAELQQHLGCRLRTRTDEVASPVAEETDRITIVTMMATVEDGLGTSIVIRADGGDQWPLPDKAFPIETDKRLGRSLLIDIVDSPPSSMERAVDSRTLHYAARGWRIVRCDGIPAGK